ncbi:hypothetical protein GXV81_005001, partial [Salmonella enterica]|nr:hypothetical protein [Salmonella enterica subsp. diarizonae serovar 48:i:z]EEH1875858.1 hypothetical protein [Salmonella enterica]EEM2738933.1 hypothetical protein [Salmonella enterica]EEN5962434.1 hypothetical protein [Salmonella enterica]EKC3540246.1 hypothetical protein [Salmonella enterica]
MLNRIVRHAKAAVPVGDKTIKVLQIVRHRGQGKRPLVATFGGLSLAWQKDTVISDNPKQVLISRSWQANWANLATFFAYPTDIRKVIYRGRRGYRGRGGHVFAADQEPVAVVASFTSVPFEI